MSTGQHVLFYPDLPKPGTVIVKVCNRLGILPTNDLGSKYVAVFKWKDATFSAAGGELLTLAEGTRVINLCCADISKAFVHRVFAQVFGYQLEVDPLTHHGRCVSKSDRNARHDGCIIDCPIQHREAGRVYMRLINNLFDSGTVYDLRVPIIGDDVPFVYIKKRSLEDRFSNENLDVAIREPNEVFTAFELQRLLSMVRSVGMDYGEIDVLRDHDSRAIYVVDVNNTPFGPPNAIPRRLGELALDRLSEAFARNFLLDSRT
jgi:hypothetical protein